MQNEKINPMILFQDMEDEPGLKLLEWSKESSDAMISEIFQSNGWKVFTIPDRGIETLALRTSIFDRLRAQAGSGDGIEFHKLRGRESFTVSKSAMMAELGRAREIIQTAKSVRAQAAKVPQAPSEPEDPQEKLMRQALALQKSKGISFAEAWQQACKTDPQAANAYRNRLKPEAGERQRAGDLLTEKAQALSKSEGLTFSQAFQKTLAQHPGLAEKYRAV